MQSAQGKNNRQFLFILGMHRSGTSATSGCMDILGYQLGKQFFQPGEDNEKGYFENKRINYFNEDLLDDLDARWHDTLHIPDLWWESEKLNDRRDELIKIIHEEFDNHARISLKDPRISVLLPFYLGVFNQLQIFPKVIINFRNPLEVAASLERRNHLSLSKSLLLWMDYTLKAELYSRALPRIFLDYTALVNDPLHALNRINKELHLDLTFEDSNVEKLQLFIEKGLKHHTLDANADGPEFPALVAQLYDLLKNSNLNVVEPVDQAQFDKYAEAFYSNFRFFSGIDEDPKLVLRTISSDKKSTLHTSPLREGRNMIELSTDQGKSVTEFWIHPANRPVALQLHNMQIVSPSGEKLDFRPKESNAEWVSETGLMIFGSEIPCIEYTFDQPVIIAHISFEIEIIAFSGFTHMMIEELNLSKSKLLEQINTLENDLEKLKSDHKKDLKRKEHQKEQLIESYQNALTNIEKEKDKVLSELDGKAEYLTLLLNSRSWKIGRAVTKPIRYIKDRNKK